MVGFVEGPGRAGPPPLPTDPTLSASVPITLTNDDLDGVPIVLRSGARVSGTLQFEGSIPPPTPVQLGRGSITFTPVEPRSYEQMPQVRIEGDGRFATSGFAAVGPAPGTQRAAGAGPIWAFKSATLEGRSLTDDPLEISDRDISGIVLAFTDRTTQLTGSVANAAGAPDRAAEVIVFPADSQSWKEGVPNPRRIRASRTSTAGIYEFSNLPPGQYHVVAVPGNAAINMQDPKFLEALAGIATRAPLADGEKKTLDLSVRTVPAVR
jgi:hypothetical protein